MVCPECEERKIRDKQEEPPMAPAERSRTTAETKKIKEKHVTTMRHKDTKINELERKLERLESMMREKRHMSPMAAAENCVAFAETCPGKAEPKKSIGESTVNTKDDRASKMNELQRKLDSLASMIEGLKEEVKGRAMEDAGAGTVDPVCNTCLVRKKGAALFPCGHIFCWKCTSDLRRGKGTCPICHDYFWNVISVSEAL